MLGRDVMEEGRDVMEEILDLHACTLAWTNMEVRG